jgi:DNA repair exonuclease SbcCD nuclease subunit
VIEVRLVHLSDSHLGKAQFNLAEREDDFYLSFSRAIDIAISEKPDLLIYTGDLFDSYRPHPRAFVKAFESLMRVIERGIPIAIIEGNHELGPDVVKKQITSPIANMEALFNRLGYGKLFIRLNARVERIGDLVIAGLPYKSFGKDVPDAISKLERECKNLCNCPSVLMIHQGVKGMIKTFYPELDFPHIASTSFDYVAMGHYHNKVVRRSGNRVFAYSGSTEIVELREAFSSDGSKYILSVDIERDGIDVKEIKLETRPFITFSEIIRNTRDLYSLIERIRDEIKGKEKPVICGRIYVKGSMKPGFSTGEIRRSLSSDALHIVIKERFEEREEVSEEIPLLGLEDTISQLISSLKIDEDIKSLAIRIFDLWYREGKRGEDFLNEVMRMVDEY